MAELSIAERVANGVKQLDREHPYWVGEINLDRLTMSSGCNCILGQLFGDYSLFVSDDPEDFYDNDGRGHAEQQLAESGFQSLVVAGLFGRTGRARRITDEEVERRDVEYKALEAEWRKVIAERQAVSR